MKRLEAIVRICAPRIARRLVGPCVVALALALVIVAALPDGARDPVDSAAIWLHLPILLLVGSAITATIETWPAFGRDRPDCGIVDRLRPGPLGGAGIAACVGCAVLAPGLVTITVVFDVALGRPHDRTIRVVHRLSTPDGEALHLRRDEGVGRLALAAPALVDAVELRPHMPLSPAGTFEATSLTVLDDAGVPLGPPTTVERAGQRVLVEFPARVIDGIRLSRGQGGAPLVLRPGAAVAQRATAASGTTAAVVVGLLAIISAMGGFAVVLLGRRRLSRNLMVVLGFLVPVAGSALDWLPQSAAIRAYARDEWPLDQRAASTGSGSLSLVAAAMLLAVVTGRPRDAE